MGVGSSDCGHPSSSRLHERTLGLLCYKARLRQLQGADAAAVTRLLLGGWLIAAVLHGTYDLLLSFGFSKWAYAQIALMGLSVYGWGSATGATLRTCKSAKSERAISG